MIVPLVLDRLAATDGHWSHMPLLGIDVGLHDRKMMSLRDVSSWDSG